MSQSTEANLAASTADRRMTIGAPREVYFVEHTKVGPNDPFCDVAWPAAPRSSAALPS